MPWVQVGAKVSPTMRAGIERLAAERECDLSDLVREGLRLILQANGIEAGLEAASPKAKPAKKMYKDGRLAELARLHPDEVATVVRLWCKPGHTHNAIAGTFRGAPAAPGLARMLTTLGNRLSSYQDLKDALVAETGVPA